MTADPKKINGMHLDYVYFKRYINEEDLNNWTNNKTSQIKMSLNFKYFKIGRVLFVSLVKMLRPNES